MRSVTKQTLNVCNSQKGFSLIELMIAMVLGMVLMAGALQVFLGVKKTFVFNSDMTSMQENARFAMEFITRDARMAGYFGCGSQAVANTLNPVSGDGTWQYQFDQGLVGYDGDDADFPTTDFPVADRPTLSSGTMPKSDVFTVLRGSTDGASFTVSDHNVTSSVVTVTLNHTYDPGDILMISDCDHAAIFQVTAGGTNKLRHNPGNSEYPGNCTKGFGLPRLCSTNGNGYEYKGDASVMEVLSHAYYVDTASNNVPSIYREEITGGVDSATEELVQGIESMQTLFGVDTSDDGMANRYGLASSITDWTTVVSLRLHLLARSLTQVTSEPVDFRFVGVTYSPSDKYLRKEFITTVKVRNRGI
jgi:type IV pilus assembly protein PilW